MMANLRRWWVGLCLAMALAALLELTGYWQTMLLAGIAAGLWVGGGWRGFGAGALGVLLAWAGYLAVFALTGPLGALSRLFVGIAGLDPSGALAWLPVILTLMIGLLLGGAGGCLGGALLPPSRN